MGINYRKHNSSLLRFIAVG